MAKPPPSPLHVSQSADRALTLLDLVVSTGAMTLGEAAEAGGLASSTALRHLRALCQRGYLRRDGDGRFSAGPGFLRLALAAFQSGPYAHLTAAATPHLERLAEATEESVYLAVRDGSLAVYIATAEGTRAIRHVGWVGRSVPVRGTAVGQALDRRKADHTGTTKADVMYNVGALESDVSAVVASVYGQGDDPVAAISVLGPASRLKGKRRTKAAVLVAEEATALSAQLGR